MDNPIEIMNQLKKLGAALQNANKQLYEISKQKAEAEKIYRCELAKEILRLRTNGVPVTIISDLARGNEEISLLKLERDKLEAFHDANKYEIKSIHERISIGQSCLAWYRQEFVATNQINE